MQRTRWPIVALLAHLASAAVAAQAPSPGGIHIRVNQVGYLPDAPKVAVVCTLTGSAVDSFTVGDERGQRVLGPLPATADRPFGPCATHGLDFSALTRPGRYRIVAGDGTRPSTRDSSCITNDFGDYSTNEPIMDGTANLTYLVAALAAGEAAPPLPLD